ncbi:MAG: VOC family protein [Vicinamibacterales bacterium]
MSAAAPASAQLIEPNQLGLRMGHVHLSVKDLDAQKQFFTDVLGGTIVKNRPPRTHSVPRCVRDATQGGRAYRAASGLGRQSHFGFTVKDMPAALAKWKAAKVEISRPKTRARCISTDRTAFASNYAVNRRCLPRSA